MTTPYDVIAVGETMLSLVATDGPLAESRESLVGFWVVDVENEARAVEIATRISRAADAPIEVRQGMDAPPDDVMEQIST